MSPSSSPTYSGSCRVSHQTCRRAKLMPCVSQSRRRYIHCPCGGVQSHPCNISLSWYINCWRSPSPARGSQNMAWKGLECMTSRTAITRLHADPSTVLVRTHIVHRYKIPARNSAPQPIIKKSRRQKKHALCADAITPPTADSASPPHSFPMSLRFAP